MPDPQHELEEFEEPTGHDLVIHQAPVMETSVYDRMEEILTRQITTTEERVQQAVDCAEAVEDLAQMNRRFNAYLGQVASKIVARDIWKAHPANYADEESFWLENGWEPHEIKYLKLWVQFHMDAVDVLKTHGGLSDEEIGDLAEKATPAKLQAVITTARSVQRQTRKKTPDPAKKIEIQQQIRTMVDHAKALHDNDFKAQMDAENGKPPRVPIMLKFALITMADGETFYTIKGTANAEQVEAFAEHRGYYSSYLDNDRADYEELTRVIRQAEGATNVTPIHRAVPTPTEELSSGWDDDDMALGA